MIENDQTRLTIALGWLLHRAWIAVGGAGGTLLVFLVLPLLQAINQPLDPNMSLADVGLAQLPPPPPPPEPEPEEEEEPEEPPEPPKLDQELPRLDLSQLELALDPGLGGAGFGAGDFGVDLNAITERATSAESMLQGESFDQEPRPTYQPGPAMTPQVRRAGGGTVVVIFQVDARGRVINPIVRSSPSPVLSQAAVAALQQWRFEPGRRNGEPAVFPMRQAISFPER